MLIRKAEINPVNELILHSYLQVISNKIHVLVFLTSSDSPHLLSLCDRGCVVVWLDNNSRVNTGIALETAIPSHSPPIGALNPSVLSELAAFKISPPTLLPRPPRCHSTMQPLLTLQISLQTLELFSVDAGECWNEMGCCIADKMRFFPLLQLCLTAAGKPNMSADMFLFSCLESKFNLNEPLWCTTRWCSPRETYQSVFQDNFSCTEGTLMLDSHRVTKCQKLKSILLWKISSRPLLDSWSSATAASAELIKEKETNINMLEQKSPLYYLCIFDSKIY